MGFAASICGTFGFINQLLPSAGNKIHKIIPTKRKAYYLARRHKGEGRIVNNVFSLFFESWGMCRNEKESAGRGHNLLAEVAGD